MSELSNAKISELVAQVAELHTDVDEWRSSAEAWQRISQERGKRCDGFAAEVVRTHKEGAQHLATLKHQRLMLVEALGALESTGTAISWMPIHRANELLKAALYELLRSTPALGDNAELAEPSPPAGWEKNRLEDRIATLSAEGERLREAFQQTVRTAMAEVERRQPWNTDISDAGDEYALGFLDGQMNAAMETFTLACAILDPVALTDEDHDYEPGGVDD
jgi:hypothetical protein